MLRTHALKLVSVFLLLSAVIEFDFECLLNTHLKRPCTSQLTLARIQTKALS